MSKLLLNYRDSWADKINIFAWQIVDADIWKTLKENFVQQVGSSRFSFSIGTNEDQVYETAQAFLAKIKEKEISVDEAVVVEKVFGCTHMGQLNILEEVKTKVDNDDVY